MTNKEYQIAAMVTNDRQHSMRMAKSIDKSQMVNAALGLTGEAGEVADIVKKTIFHEKEFDKVHLEKEIGDVLWYVVLMCDALNVDIDTIMQMNADKLANRYDKGGFNVEKANNRKAGDI